MNPAMIAIIGQDVTGQRCHRAIHNLDRQCAECPMTVIQQDGCAEIEIVSPMDQQIYHVSHAPLRHPEGGISKISIYRNVTELREKEKNLKQIQKLESIGCLAGGIAHDFNNLLFPIIGMSELLLEDLPPESPEYENTQEILKAGQRGAELVEQILAFSRQTKHKLIPIRLQQIIKEVLKLMRATIPSDIEIVHDIQKNCGLVMADPTQIHQVANEYHHQRIPRRRGDRRQDCRRTQRDRSQSRSVFRCLAQRGAICPFIDFRHRPRDTTEDHE